MYSYTINHSCTLANSHSHRSHLRPFSYRKSFYRRRHLRLLARRISKIELQLELNSVCEETTVQQSRLSLKQLQRRVERIEHHLKKENQQVKVILSPKHCLKLLLPEAKNWQVIGTLLGVPETILDNIEADHPGNCQQCVRKMIKSWLNQVDPPPSWKNLTDAVHEVNPSLARKIMNCAANAAD